MGRNGRVGPADVRRIMPSLEVFKSDAMANTLGKVITKLHDGIVKGAGKYIVGGTLELPAKVCQVDASRMTHGIDWLLHEIVEEDSPFTTLKLGDKLWYSADKTGNGTLMVSVAPDLTLFGGAHRPPPATVLLGVEPIEIEIDAPFSIDPGATFDVTAEVSNAIDTSLDWTVSDGHELIITGEHTVRIQAADDNQTFPIVLIATSTSTKGMRGRVDAPERSTIVTIRRRSCQPELTASAQCNDGSATVVAARLRDAVCEAPDPVSDTRWSASSPAEVTRQTRSDASFSVPSTFDGTIEVSAQIADARDQPEPAEVLVSCGCEGAAADRDTSQCLPGAAIVRVPSSCISVCKAGANGTHSGLSVVELPLLPDAGSVSFTRDPSRSTVMNWLAANLVPGDILRQADGYIMQYPETFEAFLNDRRISDGPFLIMDSSPRDKSAKRDMISGQLNYNSEYLYESEEIKVPDDRMDQVWFTNPDGSRYYVTKPGPGYRTELRYYIVGRKYTYEPLQSRRYVSSGEAARELQER